MEHIAFIIKLQKWKKVEEYDLNWKQKYITWGTSLLVRSLDIKIRWSGDWDSDRSFAEQKNFHDLPHFELV